MFELTGSNGDLTCINGLHSPFRLTSQVVNVNSLKYFSVSNMVSLNLKGSNVHRVSAIFHGDLPNLTELNFEGCSGIIDSDVSSVKGVPKLGNIIFTHWKMIDISFLC